METLALILAGGRGSRLDILSEHRAKPSVPFGGKFRIIDFALSNCVNSGIFDVGILTQYLPLSLNEHIGVGKPWDLDRKKGGVTLLQPYTSQRSEANGWYEGTAHAIYKNLRFIKRNNPKYVVMLSGDHIYKMDYSKMLAEHKAKNADLTIAVQEVPFEDVHRFGIMETNDNMKVENFQEKPETSPSNLASMGIYIFSADKLIDILERKCSAENSDFGHHIIPEMIEKNEVYAYKFDGYWKDVGTYEAYVKANLDLTNQFGQLEFDLYDKNWVIQTRSEERPPVKFGVKGNASKTLVSNGCIISGKVENSVLGSGVIVEPGAIVRNSIIFNDTVIKKDTIVSDAIIDKEVVIGDNSHIGFGDDLTPNQEKPDLLSSGITVIAKGVKIPNNTQIGRNCRIFSEVTEVDFKDKIIKSGTTLRPKK